METQFNMKLQMNYLQKDKSAHMLKCGRVINSSYKVFARPTIAHLNKYWHVWAHASAIAHHSLTGLVCVGDWQIQIIFT